MNYHLCPVSFRKYSLILIYIFVSIGLLVWYLEFYFETIYGDLTRVGNFSERDFGWRSSQEIIPVEHFKDYPLAEADILVIGDSFSMPLAWQARLVAEGLKIATIHWDELKTVGVWGSLPDNLGVALRTAGFKGRYLIIESVERLFQQRMETLSKEHNPIVKYNLVINKAPFAQRQGISLNKLNGISWSAITLYNKMRLSFHFPDNGFESGLAKVMAFDGCQVFSHRLCHYAIFFGEDFNKKTFTEIANVLTVNKEVLAIGIQPIWLIVPDRATVYLGYGQFNKYPYQNIWKQFAQYPELIAPDLGELFRQKSQTVKDFYMPNDSHLSTNGFLYFGDIMNNGLRNIKANQAKPQLNSFRSF
jgi:hypothetical protein